MSEALATNRWRRFDRQLHISPLCTHGHLHYDGRPPTTCHVFVAFDFWPSFDSVMPRPGPLLFKSAAAHPLQARTILHAA